MFQVGVHYEERVHQCVCFHGLFHWVDLQTCPPFPLSFLYPLVIGVF